MYVGGLRVLHNIKSVIRDDIINNKYTYLSLFLFYIIGIVLGSFAINDMNFQQRDEMTKYFNGFMKLLDSNGLDSISLFKISIFDSLKIIILFWIFGFFIICIPVYYIVIGMRGFTTGFSS